MEGGRLRVRRLGINFSNFGFTIFAIQHKSPNVLEQHKSDLVLLQGHAGL